MSIIELLVRYGTWSRPGVGGTAARAPTLMKIGRELGTVHRHFLFRDKAAVALVNSASLQGLQ